MHRPTSPEPRGGSFRALLGLPTTQAMELLLPVAPTFPSDPGLVDRAARFSAFAASSSSSPPDPAAKRKDPGDRTTNKVGKAAKKGRVEAGSAAGEDAEEEKPAYVHVRARRGQATDSHSIAERARREKINARMELLKELVPGCSKVSGTALVLDEIINHVQSLQRQVEYLSMRLSTVNPRVDFGGLDSLLATECGRTTGLNCKNVMDLEPATWPELGIYGARQLAQLQQQFWHGSVTHPHQLALMSDKRDDDHPPVLASSGASLFGYDLASSGHYMSATAKMWASTHNDTLYAKMLSVVDALYDCQKKMGTGYLSAFPSEFFDRVEAIKAVWAPYYTIHKIMQGLLDQYTVAGNSKALEMVVGMANYFSDRVKNVIQKYSIERHWTSLNEETGGMNDVLYQLYTITNDQKHLTLAHLFDKPCFLGLLAVQADSISGFHSNTHIPVVIGAQMRYEVTGDLVYKQIVTFFMDTINSSHSYATGGTSAGEFWTNPKRLAETLSTENEESCTTYNMLKVSRNLFRWTKEIAYADYYERALINGVLSIQRGMDPGVMIYMLPQAPGRSKAVSYHGWGTKYDSFWCCYGTGIESFSKLGDSIYFEEKGDTPALSIIQYIPSTFNWKTAGLTVTQQLKPLSSSDLYLKVSLSISAKKNDQSATLNVRIPSWTSANGAKVTLNDKDLGLITPGSFLSISKQWNSDDHLSLQFPITLWTEAIKDDRPEYASLQAVLFGPFVLAGLSTGDWDAKAGNISAISEWITAVPSSYNLQLVTFTQESSGKTFVLSSSNGSLTMQERPEVDGTDTAIHATFRVHSQDSTRLHDAYSATVKGTSVQIEPFDLPGTVITNNLTLSGQKNSDSFFNVVPGLDGKPNSVSIELGTKPGCFLVAGADYSTGTKIQVSCRSSLQSIDGILEQAASFVQTTPLTQYHPISFIAKGVRRNFLLEPLYSLRDEFYTIYFNLGA